MHRLALRRIAKLFMTICPEPVEFSGLQKSVTAKRVHKVLKVFGTYQLPSSDTSEAGLKITHGVLPVKKHLTVRAGHGVIISSRPLPVAPCPLPSK